MPQAGKCSLHARILQGERLVILGVIGVQQVDKLHSILCRPPRAPERLPQSWHGRRNPERCAAARLPGRCRLTWIGVSIMLFVLRVRRGPACFCVCTIFTYSKLR